MECLPFSPQLWVGSDVLGSRAPPSAPVSCPRFGYSLPSEWSPQCSVWCPSWSQNHGGMWNNWKLGMIPLLSCSTESGKVRAFEQKLLSLQLFWLWLQCLLAPREMTLGRGEASQGWPCPSEPLNGAILLEASNTPYTPLNPLRIPPRYPSLFLMPLFSSDLPHQGS